MNKPQTALEYRTTGCIPLDAPAFADGTAGMGAPGVSGGELRA